MARPTYFKSKQILEPEMASRTAIMPPSTTATGIH
jgi:hypothetical protein